MKEVTEAPAPGKRFKSNRFLPYLAVYQSDVHQTLNCWVYRVWVLLSLLVAIGYLLYRFGAYKEAGMVQPAAELVSDLLSWSMLGSVTLIIILTTGSISSERGTLADSVLSRGISRYQYFFGKWHARLTVVLCTFAALATLILVGSFFLLRDENLSLTGSLVALGTVAALLVVVITCGVTVSALSNNTILGITVVLMLLYGGGFLLSLLPASYPSPDRALRSLPNILRGLYDLHALTRLVGGALIASLVLALVGVVCFSRRDV